MDWIKGLFRKFDRIAGMLLPAELATRFDSPPTPPPAESLAVRRGAKINRSNIT